MLSMLVRDKPVRIMIALKEPDTIWYLSKLAKATGTTYVFVTKFISKLEKEGIVTLETKGKKRIVKLTDKGIQVATLFEEIKNKLETKSPSQN